jgi:hypothetical protein
MKKILIFSAFVIIFASFVFWWRGSVSENATPQIQEQVSATLSDTEHQKNIEQQYLTSDYRVLTVLDNTHAPYTVTVATERADECKIGTSASERCANDTSCGSIYTSPTCFFFVEPKYVYGADPTTRSAGILKWGGVLQLDSFVFENANFLKFVTLDGDGGAAVKREWRLDLSTGTFTKLSENSGDI